MNNPDKKPNKNQNKKMKKFLKSTYFIDWDNEKVKNKAKELTSDVEDTPDKIKSNIEKSIKLFDFVRDEIKYIADFKKDSYKKDKFKASVTLENGFGFCIPKSVIMAALSRAIGIPSRLHFVDIENHLTSESFKKRLGSGIFIYHGYAEIFLNGKWVEANVAFDSELCKRKGYPIVYFDGINPGLFAKKDESGKPFIEYIKDRGTNKDVPFLKILKTWAIEYGFKRKTHLD